MTLQQFALEKNFLEKKIFFIFNFTKEDWLLVFTPRRESEEENLREEVGVVSDFFFAEDEARPFPPLLLLILM